MKANKNLGQHFLVDEGVIAQIIRCIHPQPGQAMLEIGPGLGALTFPLLERLEALTVIELDERVLSRLRVGKPNGSTLHIHHGDALAFDFTANVPAAQKWRVCGNLPYQISTPLLFHVLQHAAVINDMVFMVQKEVAERIAASVGSKQYGRLSVMLQYACQCEALFPVPPTAFDPMPRVDSMMIRLRPYTQLPYVAKEKPIFEKVVKAAFSQRRKTLRNSLRGIISAEALMALNIAPEARAETISVEKYVTICNQLSA